MTSERQVKHFLIESRLPEDEVDVWYNYPEEVCDQIVTYMIEAGDCVVTMSEDGELMTAIEVYHDRYIEEFGDYRDEEEPDDGSDFYYEQSKDA